MLALLAIENIANRAVLACGMAEFGISKGLACAVDVFDVVSPRIFQIILMKMTQMRHSFRFFKMWLTYFRF